MIDDIYGQADGDEPMSAINITPFVDVMLVLMIVFMIAMPILTQTIAVSLPTTTTDQPAKSPKEQPLYLTITSDGQYMLDDVVMTKETLSKTLTHKKQQSPTLVLAIYADKQAVYDEVAQVLNIAKTAGIDKIGFVTQIE